MKQETKKELFNLLYDLEIFLEYDKTKEGKKLGKFINKLQKELLTN
jgi:hypothetical protein|tara:strand:- start:948 stop:1085 length:138 start_codon:yes stop_codon:yes gene_type:complete